MHKYHATHKDTDREYYTANKEHLTPIARGGRHDLDNIDFTHYGCNAQKQDRTLEEYREWRERVA